MEECNNIKSVLANYEVASGQHVNLAKSDVFSKDFSKEVYDIMMKLDLN